MHTKSNTMANKKILGIGSALTDILTQIEDESILAELHLPKGSMTHIDGDTSKKIAQRLTSFDNQMAAGGSAANTVSGLAKLGIEAGFLGKVGQDEVGQFFEKSMADSNVKLELIKTNTLSGRVQAFVTEDGERTFATYLGASSELSPDDIKPELFKGWDIFYVEGYLVFNPNMLNKAMETAKSAGLKIAIDLASYNMVEDHRDYMLQLIENYVDIVFANESEAKALTGMEPEEAIDFIASRCEIAVVKVGKKGAYIKRGNEVIKVDSIKCNPIDTTGAGDMWAAGFLAGLVKDEPLAKCGNMGAIVAGNVIEVMGAKMSDERWDNIYKAIAKL